LALSNKFAVFNEGYLERDDFDEPISCSQFLETMPCVVRPEKMRRVRGSVLQRMKPKPDAATIRSHGCPSKTGYRAISINFRKSNWTQ
jgi:hypothetical protein